MRLWPCCQLGLWSAEDLTEAGRFASKMARSHGCWQAVLDVHGCWWEQWSVPNHLGLSMGLLKLCQLASPRANEQKGLEFCTFYIGYLNLSGSLDWHFYVLIDGEGIGLNLHNKPFSCSLYFSWSFPHNWLPSHPSLSLFFLFSLLSLPVDGI